MVKPNHRPLLYGYADDFILPEPVNKLKLLSDLYDLIFSVEYSVPPDYQPGRINKNSIIHIGTFDWSRKKHIYKHILDGLKAHNLVVSYGQPRIILSSENRKVAREWLKNEKIDNEKFIVAINPGSRLTRSLRSYINLIYLLVMTAVHLI